MDRAVGVHHTLGSEALPDEYTTTIASSAPTAASTSASTSSVTAIADSEELVDRSGPGAAGRGPGPDGPQLRVTLDVDLPGDLADQTGRDRLEAIDVVVAEVMIDGEQDFDARMIDHPRELAGPGVGVERDGDGTDPRHREVSRNPLRSVGGEQADVVPRRTPFASKPFASCRDVFDVAVRAAPLVEDDQLTIPPRLDHVVEEHAGRGRVVGERDAAPVHHRTVRTSGGQPTDEVPSGYARRRLLLRRVQGKRT